jgi:hypothetical protein
MKGLSYAITAESMRLLFMLSLASADVVERKFPTPTSRRPILVGSLGFRFRKTLSA